MNNQPTWPHQPKEHGTIRLLALWFLLEYLEQAVSKSSRIGEDSVQAEGGQPTGWPPAPAPCPKCSTDGNHRAGVFRELHTLLVKELEGCAMPPETRRVAEILELLGWGIAARTWWKKAAAKGDEDARDYLEVLETEQEDEPSACRKRNGIEAYAAGTFTPFVMDPACHYADARVAAEQVESGFGEAGLKLPAGTQALIREVEDFLTHLDHTTGGPRC